VEDVELLPPDDQREGPDDQRTDRVDDFAEIRKSNYHYIKLQVLLSKQTELVTCLAVLKPKRHIRVITIYFNIRASTVKQ
jgi:hypothetical protein